MSAPAAPASARSTRARLPTAVLEAVGVTLIGGTLALLANQLSPRGLKLTRDYFPAVTTTVLSGPSDGTAQTNAVSARLRARGLQTMDRAAVEALTREARYLQGLALILDARNAQQYRAGHVPGALQFDHYRAEQHLATVIPACLAAEVVVVYCEGGDCEDSEFAAVMLRDAGIPNERLFIYEGGLADWASARLPLETGDRFSGEIKPSAP